MPEEQQPDFTAMALSEFNTKLRDLEEKQRLLKERVLLIGQNLIDSKEELEKAMTELKLSLEEIKQETGKIKETVLMQADALDKKARKNEVEILAKQMKMFQPLEFARIEDVKKMLKKR